MIKLSTQKTKRQLAIHGWAGLLFGFLLYIVVFTGSVLVFEKELAKWSKSGFEHANPLQALSIDALVEQQAEKIAPEFWEDIDISYEQGNVNVFFHVFKKNKKGFTLPYGVQYTYNFQKGKVYKQAGFAADFEDPPSGEWMHFIDHMHTNLYIPGRLGLYATGLLGLLLLVSAVSGFLLHRHLIKDMFLSPRKSSVQLNKRDGHNLSATWALPYAFILAFTGAFLSFAVSLGLPAIAFTAYKGNIQEASAALITRADVNEVAPSDDGHYSLDALIDLATQKAGVAPSSLTVFGYNEPQTVVTTNHLPGDKSPIGHRLMFNGNNGEFVREVAFIGPKPSISSDSLSLMTVLHFGNFAGVLSKALWFGLGLLLCYVIITGFKLWFARRMKDANWLRLYLSVPIITYGVPVSFLCAGVAFFYVYSNKTRFPYELSIWLGFIVGWLLSLASLIWIRYVDKRNHELALANGFETHEDEASKITRFMAYSNQYFYFLMAYLLILMPVMRWQSNGIGWLTLHNTDNHMVILVDLCFACMGLFFLNKLLKQQKTKTHTQSLLVNNNQAKGNSA